MPPNSGTRWKPAIEEGDQAAADEVVREDADEERDARSDADDAEARHRMAEHARAQLVGKEAVDAADDEVDEVGRAGDGREQHHAGDELVLEEAADALARAAVYGART